MAVTSSGAISLSNIADEFGGSTPHAISEYIRGGDGLVPDGPAANEDIPETESNMQFSDFYGSVSDAATDFINTFTTGRSPAAYIVGDTFTISSAGLYTFNNLNLEQVDIDIRGGAGGGGFGRNTYRSAPGTWVDSDFTYFSGDNGGRVVCRMAVGTGTVFASGQTMEVRVATGGVNETAGNYTSVTNNGTQAGGTQGGGTGRSGGGGGGGRSYWDGGVAIADTLLVVAGGGGGGFANGMGQTSVLVNGSAGCDVYSVNLEQDLTAAGGGGGYYGGASACGTAHPEFPNIIPAMVMGNSGSGSNRIHSTYAVSTTQNSTYSRSSGYTGYFKMTVVSIT